MKIKLIYIGKVGSVFADGITCYLDRLAHYCDVETVSMKEAKKLPPEKTVETEGARILKALEGEHCFVALSEDGQKMPSVEFANWLSVSRTYTSTITFVIGGAFGLSKEVKDKADLVLALSHMTFQHDLAQLVLLEQLYRAMTIMRGENYHK